MKNKIESFLIKHKAHHSSIDVDQFIKDFISEMNKGLTSKSSLAMEPTYIDDSFIVKKNNKKYILLDAGGTNLRGCIGYTKNGKPIFENVKTTKMFGTQKLVNKQTFYNSFYSFIKSISLKSYNIGCCFSFTCKMNNQLDGKILYFGKNIKTSNVIGTYFGKELKSKFNNKPNISIVNDAVTTNLGIQYKLKEKSNVISYIWGTGVNASYYENATNIRKINVNKNKKELINVEVCGFNKFELSDFEKELIKTTNKKDIFEKTSGGVYLADVINNALNTANKEKLIMLNKKANLSLTEYSQLLVNKQNSLFKNNTSFLVAKTIIKEIIKRAAKLNALVLSSIILKSKINKNTVVIEGSTILKLPYLKKYFIYYTKKYTKNTNINFLTDNNLNFKGALLVAAQKD